MRVRTLASLLGLVALSTTQMACSSDLPNIAEPWFLAFNASIEVTPAMVAEDIEKAGPAIELAVKNYG